MSEIQILFSFWIIIVWFLSYFVASQKPENLWTYDMGEIEKQKLLHRVLWKAF